MKRGITFAGLVGLALATALAGFALQWTVQPLHAEVLHVQADSKQSNEIVVSFGPCSMDWDVAVTEDSQSIVVTVILDGNPSLPWNEQLCTLEATYAQVQLGSAIGDRIVVDGSSGQVLSVDERDYRHQYRPNQG